MSMRKLTDEQIVQLIDLLCAGQNNREIKEWMWKEHSFEISADIIRYHRDKNEELIRKELGNKVKDVKKTGYCALHRRIGAIEGLINKILTQLENNKDDWGMDESRLIKDLNTLINMLQNHLGENNATAEEMANGMVVQTKIINIPTISDKDPLN